MISQKKIKDLNVHELFSVFGNALYAREEFATFNGHHGGDLNIMRNKKLRDKFQSSWGNRTVLEWRYYDLRLFRLAHLNEYRKVDTK